MKDSPRLVAPPDAAGALYFLPGQYLFKRIEDGREVAKALSSEQIARAFREYRTDTGWIERRILRYREQPEGNYLLSYEPAQTRTIFVETGKGEVQEISVPLPTLVLFGKGREFYLWAAKARRITPKTLLSHAPLPNLAGGGSDLQGKICFGKNEVPECRADRVDAVWNLIFNAPFNGDHANGKCRSEPQDVRRLLLGLANRKARSFPAKELLESNTSIEQVWARATGDNSYRYF
jgi:PRTRC genetic system protein B